MGEGHRGFARKAKCWARVHDSRASANSESLALPCCEADIPIRNRHSMTSVLATFSHAVAKMRACCQQSLTEKGWVGLK